MNLKVTKIVNETWDTKTFFMEDLEESGRTWDYVAGQYLTFRFDSIGEKPLVRSYTMSSSPNQANHSAVTIKRVVGGVVSNWFCDKVDVGTVLRARGPIGKFVYDPTIDHANLVMIAAGSGVTPFVSIMREYCKTLGQQGSPKSMTLLVSYRSRKDLILWSDLEAVSTVPGCRVITTLSRDQEAPSSFWQGRIDDAMLTRLFGGEFNSSTVMTCGPGPIMELVRQHGTSNGIAQEHLKMESFES
jgi:ferredoxin-NADP reductase